MAEYELPTGCDICATAMADAFVMLRDREGTAPSGLVISACELDLDMATLLSKAHWLNLLVDTGLPDDAWYIQDFFGNRVWGSGLEEYRDGQKKD